MSLRHEAQDRDEGGARGEEGQEPDTEELVHGNVEDEVLGIVCCRRHAFQFQPASPVRCFIKSHHAVFLPVPEVFFPRGWRVERVWWWGWGWREHTNTIDTDIDPRAHNLVPTVYTPDQPPAALEAARAAKRMREGGRGGEVCFEGFPLGGGRGLREEADDLGDLGFFEEVSVEGLFVWSWGMMGFVYGGLP